MNDDLEIIKRAGIEAEEIIEKSNNNNLKNPIYFWQLKKKILKEKYNIDWKTPQEENPNINFD